MLHVLSSLIRQGRNLSEEKDAEMGTLECSVQARDFRIVDPFPYVFDLIFH